MIFAKILRIGRRMINVSSRLIKLLRIKSIRKGIRLLKVFGIKGFFSEIVKRLRDRSAAVVSRQTLLNTLNVEGNKLFDKQQDESVALDIPSIIEGFSIKPLISVIVADANNRVSPAVRSFDAQTYSNRELCESIETAKGEFVVLLSHDGELTNDALFWIVKEINENPDADFIYSDECRVVPETGEKCDFFCKPDWSPSLLLNYNYIGSLAVYKTELLRKLGGFREKLGHGMSYNLTLRAGDAAQNIRHIERILLLNHRKPSSKNLKEEKTIVKSEMRALKDWYRRNGFRAKISDKGGIYKASIRHTKYPKISIIIPSDNLENIIHSVNVLVKKTGYPNYEVIVVTNSKIAKQLEDFRILYLEFRICPYDKPYNFSDKCNAGAMVATGEALCFYNDDVFPLKRDWLHRILDVLILPGVGGVTPLQMSDDNLILNSGVVLGTPGLHAFAYQNVDYSDSMSFAPYHSPHLIRDVSGLSGSCITIKKDVFEKIEMFDAINTPSSFSDTGISIRLREHGFRCVNTGYARVYHENKISWAKLEKPDKVFIYIMKFCGKYLMSDPFFTDSMKAVYGISPPPEIFKFFAAPIAVSENSDGRDIMLVSHELSRSGAPIVLLDMARILLENGDYPIIASPYDGPLRQECLDMGISVLIDNSLSGSSPIDVGAFNVVARNFDIVVVNTLVNSRAINALSHSLPSVLWWIHESPISFHNLRHSLPEKLTAKTKAYAVSNYNANALTREGLSYELGRLAYGVPDQATGLVEHGHRKVVTFLVVGTIDYRKGLDVLVSAISKIEMDVIKNAQFILIGSPVNYTVRDPEVHEIIRIAKEKYDNFITLGNMPRGKVLEWYSKSDCLIIPSREDPLPVVATEAMMFSKPVICSDQTGTAEYITQKVNGIVFPSENSDMLAEHITFAIENRDEMAQMGQRARKDIYEKHFTMERFKINALQAIDEVTQANAEYRI